MTAFKARKLKKGWFEIVGLEAFLEAKLKKLKWALGKPATKAKWTKAKKVAKKAPARPVSKEVTPLVRLTTAMNKHSRRSELIRAGKEKDQLLRSLVPLYVARSLSHIEVNSGLISRFWAKYGVKYAPPNAAKALRQHVGYARNTKAGKAITPNGIKYVEAALQRKAA
ncbi:MAG: hypothetical protein ACOZIN_18615 [Myxococcota bacterium]